MNIQYEIMYRCAVVSEGICAIRGITDIRYRFFLFVNACVYAMRALAMLFISWGFR